jgi:DNA repair protein RecO (recombination protein O)
MLHRLEGIVIRSMDYGESNKIITIFTRDAGKVGIMVRGAKKMNSRHSAITQLFTYGEFVFFKSGSQMGTLNHADILTSHHRLRADLMLTAYCAYMAEMVDRIGVDNEPNPYIYEQLQAALVGVEEGKDPQMITHFFEMKMLIQAGYAPNFEQCSICGQDTDNPLLHIQLGGMICDNCSSDNPNSQLISITDGLLKLLRLLVRVDLNRLGKVEVKPDTKQLLKKVMRAFFLTHIGIQFRSQHVMDQMEKYGV